MKDLIILKYRFRFFLKIGLKVLYVLVFIIVIFVLYLSLFVRGSYFYKKKVIFLNYLGTLISNNINSNICNYFYIDGTLHSNYSNIQKYVNEYCSNENYKIVDLKSDILKDPWIKNLTIYKKYPNKLEIKIVEYNPFAIWVNDKNEYKLIDEYGDVINVSSTKVKQFKNLIIIVGDNIKPEIYNIFNLLSIYSSISNNLVKIIRIGDRRWDLILKNGLIVKLPEEDSDFFKIWKELDYIINMCRNDYNLETIDLRIKNKIYLKYKDTVNNEIIYFE